MKRTDEGDKYLDFLGETLEQRRFSRALALGVSVAILGAHEMTM